MRLGGIKVLVTGGAGFIGSHLVDELMERGATVCVVDNLSSGTLRNVERWLDDERFEFIRGDLLDPQVARAVVVGCDIVFHLAANPEVRVSAAEPAVHFQQNVVVTYNLLEAVRKMGGIKTLVFTSSSTVYGEAARIPTPEDYGPLMPISIYGASKLACEALITAYSRSYKFRAVILRLANIVGSRSRHGVIHDFIIKLKRNPRKLEILGDGTQSKSYLHVSDCISAMLLALEKSNAQVEILNVGSEDWVNVRTIARVVTEEMGLRDTEFGFTGGVEGGRGWVGDVKYMLLDVSKLKSLGWRPKCNSYEAVRLATRELIRELAD